MATGWVNLATTDTLSASRAQINTGFTELTNNHLDTTNPTNVTDAQWYANDNNDSVGLYNSAGAAFVTVIPDRLATQGGLAWLSGALDFTGTVGGVSAAAAGDFPTAAQLETKVHSMSIRIGGLSGSDDRYLWTIPATDRYAVSQVWLISDTATSGSTAGNRWEFTVRNLSAAVDLQSTIMRTDSVEITANARYTLAVNQNQTKADLTGGDVLELQVVQTGSPPTSLTSAEITVQVDYTVALFA